MEEMQDLVHSLSVDSAVDLLLDSKSTTEGNILNSDVINSDTFDTYSIDIESANTSSEETAFLPSFSAKSEAELNIIETEVPHNLNVLEATEVIENSVENMEKVDLTNDSLENPRTLTNNDVEVIEILDDTFRTNLSADVIETIDLVDSDPDGGDGREVAMECPICMESLEGRAIMATVCGHIFCAECIRNAVKKNKNCPNCRKKLNSNGIHPIYLDF